MSYAAILVHALSDPAAGARLKLAADLANRFDAALIGVAAEIFEPDIATGPFGYIDPELLKTEAAALQADLRAAEATFSAAARGVGRGSEWRCGVGLPEEVIAAECRSADLIVLGPGGAGALGLHNRVDAGDVVMRAGRPVLVTPPDMAELKGSNVVVAWKDSREARRAVRDALPLLKRADQVLLVEICEGREEAEARTALTDVAAFLGRHDVIVQADVRTCDGEPAGPVLLRIAEAQGAGLIVAGGYGHSRLGEWAFGGVTRELLTHWSGAVLLSH